MGDGRTVSDRVILPAAFRTATSIRRDQSEVCNDAYRGLTPSMLFKEKHPRTDTWSDTVR